MIERKPHHLQRQFITLNSRARRHSSLPYLVIKKPTCMIAQLAPSELNGLFNYLSFVDLVKLHEALRSNRKTKEAAKGIMTYLAKSERIFSVA